MPFEVGIFTFGEPTRDANGQSLDVGGSLQDVLDWARVADAAGLDVFEGSITGRSLRSPPRRWCSPLRQRRPRVSG